jgi:hypothetical protein
MPRPTTRALQKQADGLRALSREDPQAREHLNAVKRILTKRFRRDADQLYQVLWGFLLFPGSRDDDPRVRLLMKVLDKILADQREFQPIGDGSPTGAMLELHIHAPPGTEIRRGTREAREEAIEVEATRRRDLEEEGRLFNGATAQDNQGVPGSPELRSGP